LEFIDLGAGCGGFAGTEAAGCWLAIGIYCWGLVGGCGSAYEVGVGGDFAGGNFFDYGGGSFLGAVERAGFDFGDVFDSGGRATGASFDYLGDFGGMYLGGGEYSDDFCDSRCGVEYCVSVVEFE